MTWPTIGQPSNIEMVIYNVGKKILIVLNSKFKEGVNLKSNEIY